MNRQQLTAPEGVFEAIHELEFDQTANIAAEAGQISGRTPRVRMQSRYRNWSLIIGQWLLLGEHKEDIDQCGGSSYHCWMHRGLNFLSIRPELRRGSGHKRRTAGSGSTNAADVHYHG